MDSNPIAQFLEVNYPEPQILLKSELGAQIEAQSRATVGKVFLTSVMPREMKILSLRSQEYFRRTREAMVGHRLEDLLDPDEEERSWNTVNEGMRALSDLMQTHQAEGPFVLGARPSYADFFITGSLQCARVVDEELFQRTVKYRGLDEIYKACLPYMEKRD